MARNEDSWTAEVRRQAYVAVRVASIRQVAGTNTLGYYVRRAIANGLTPAEVCEAGNLDAASVKKLSDPDTAAA